MGKLTSERINELAAKRGVRAIAVRNFLGSLPSDAKRSDALANLEEDGRSYRWNSATIAAIRQGIREHCSGSFRGRATCDRGLVFDGTRKR